MAFGIAWTLQLVSLYGVGLSGVTGQLIYTVCNGLCMLAPGITVLIACKGLKEEKTGLPLFWLVIVLFRQFES